MPLKYAWLISIPTNKYWSLYMYSATDNIESIPSYFISALDFFRCPALDRTNLETLLLDDDLGYVFDIPIDKQPKRGEEDKIKWPF